jgi:hypothetical protein
MKSKKKRKLEVPAPPFLNEFWETVLRIKEEDSKRFNCFSYGFRRSAEIYKEQRDRMLAAQKQAA